MEPTASASASDPHPAAPDAFSFEKRAGGIEEYRLDANGLQVLFMPEAAAPVACFMLTYRVGSRHERTGLTGATHMLEHLMFKGTEHFNARDGTSIFHTLQRVGARVNASTWFDRTNYYELLPKEHLPKAVEIEADRMRGLLLRPEDVERERTVILNEHDQGQNDPFRNLYHAVWAAAFTAHAYHHPTIGWRPDVEAASPEDLRGFYDRFYWPPNATATIIGDVEREEALGLVAEHFGSIDRGPGSQANGHATNGHAPGKAEPTREPEQRGERRVEVRQQGQLGALLVAYKGPPGLTEDADALAVLARILASGKGSRCYRRLTDRGLTAEVVAMSPRLHDPGLFSLFAFLAPEKTHDEVEMALEEVIQNVKEEGVAEDEVARAKRQLKAQEAFGRDGPFAIAAQLNEALAAGDWTLYAQFMDRIEQVTPADVQRVARQYLNREKRTVGTYVPV
ncbi:MAG: insulinase family protein [Bacteroidetes bacterium QS_9_68_14]|nr:MAG: insulinase family protein [Bacteroidetes bacterium QS_9_68_14]